MTEAKHYDGDAPEEPLPPEHFREDEQNDARDLGDGSPAIEPRRKSDELTPPTKKASTTATRSS